MSTTEPQQQPQESPEIDPKKLTSLKLLLYPESLEQYSKVTTILSDDFSFNILLPIYVVVQRPSINSPQIT